MEIEIRTGKARQTYRRPVVVGYRWKANAEYEVLDCGHDRPVSGLSYDFEVLDEDVDLDIDDIEFLVPSPSRRPCRECPIPHKGLSE